MNSTIERITLPKGVHLTHIELRNELNRWIGNVILESGVRAIKNSRGVLAHETCVRYYSITNWGNYSYTWYYIGTKWFEDFIRECAEEDQKYMLEKLCPEECDVFLLEESIMKARALLKEAYNEDDILPEKYEYCNENLGVISSEQELYDWYKDDYGDSDGYENFVHGLSLRACGYRDNVLPLLAEVLKNG